MNNYMNNWLVLFKAVEENKEKLGVNSISDFEDNLELEMKSMHYLQTNGIIPHDLPLFFPKDNFVIKFLSHPMFFIAFSTAESSKEYMYIRMLYVPEEYRSKKVGKQVVEDLKILCREIKSKSIQVEATEESLGFWDKLGFVKIQNSTNNRMIFRL